MQEYLAAVSVNINGLTNKMMWNAHCRAVNLLANAGKKSLPFMSIHHFDRHIFEDFGPGNTAHITHKMNESWHRTAPQPVMVRYTPKHYPIGHHTSPFEEIDEVANTLFGDKFFDKSLPSGRPVKPPSSKKTKCRNWSGARARNLEPNIRHDNWLASLVPSLAIGEQHPSQNDDLEPGLSAQITSRETEDRVLSDTTHLQEEYFEDTSPQTARAEASRTTVTFCTDGLSRLEQLFEEYGADALGDHCHNKLSSSDNVSIEQVPTWPKRLLCNHKRQVKTVSLEVSQRALPSIRAVISEAISQGYRPTDPNIEELIIDVETRERIQATDWVSKNAIRSVETPVQEVPKKQKESQHSKKRKRDQHGIRMFNKPVQPSKKKRKTDWASLGVEDPASRTKEATSTGKQKASSTNVSNAEPKQSKHMLARKQVSQHLNAPPIGSPLLPSHPSGSKTLEDHQQLPPTAFFEARNLSEKPVWRCGIKHALGHYYNAGDRKYCPGCFTALSDNINAKFMDFYMPSRTHFHQPDPTHSWRPSKLFGRARRSTTLSHNSIAKEAYWSAIATGSTEDDAYVIAVNTVTEHLKPKPRREPTPEPEPEPEPDLGPHPSGSTTIEHSQDLPECAYFSKREPFEEAAWRCDVNHALGRYYLAGDKRSCPGCGSNKNGLGKHMEMDFYLPTGVVVRQDVEELKWKPRKPYKMRDGKGKAPDKMTPLSHNQIASKIYRDALATGQEHDEALRFAIEETDKQLDEKEASVLQKIADRAKAKIEKTISERRSTAPSTTTLRNKRSQAIQQQSSGADFDTCNNTTAYDKRHHDHDPSVAETDDAEADQTSQETEATSPVEDMTDSSSSDESSSGSDSE